MCRRPPWGCLWGPRPCRPGATPAPQLAVSGERSDRLPESFRHQVQEGLRRGEMALLPQAGATGTPASAEAAAASPRVQVTLNRSPGNAPREGRDCPRAGEEPQGSGRCVGHSGLCALEWPEVGRRVRFSDQRKNKVLLGKNDQNKYKRLMAEKKSSKGCFQGVVSSGDWRKDRIPHTSEVSRCGSSGCGWPRPRPRPATLSPTPQLPRGDGGAPATWTSCRWPWRPRAARRPPPPRRGGPSSP